MDIPSIPALRLFCALILKAGVPFPVAKAPKAAAKFIHPASPSRNGARYNRREAPRILPGAERFPLR